MTTVMEYLPTYLQGGDSKSKVTPETPLEENPQDDAGDVKVSGRSYAYLTIIRRRIEMSTAYRWLNGGLQH